MKILSTPIAGLAIAETTPMSDVRGSFARFFCAQELAPILGGSSIVQINHSVTSQKGALRGLHFQYPPHAEKKFVRCMKGRVLDIAVDLRKSSPTFLQYHAEELSAENAKMLCIPEGFAHGFQTLENGCELLYLHTAFYKKDAEGGLRYDDPRINIKWPLGVTDISARDQAHPLLPADFKGIVL